MEHIKKEVKGLVEKYHGKDSATYEKMVPIILKKGVENVNLSMFGEEMRNNIMNSVGEELIKKGKVTEAVKAFVATKNNAKLVSIGNDFCSKGMFSDAIDCYQLAEDKDKLSAYKTLYECLLTVSKLLAPYMPFLSESIYKNLTDGMENSSESVHLEEYPIADEGLIDKELNFKMDIARRVVGLGRTIRNKINIKIRQPLETVMIYFGEDEKKKEAVKHFEDIIKDELNVKGINIIEDLEDLVTFDIKPNLKLLGPKYGKMMQGIREALKKEDPARISSMVRNNKVINLKIDGKQVEILPEEVLVDVKSKKDYGIETDGRFTVGMSKDISDELKQEGFCRELVHHIQNFRKESDFKIENTISLYVKSEEKWVNGIVEKYIEYIKKETLAENLSHIALEDHEEKYIKIEGKNITIGIKVAGSIV